MDEQQQEDEEDEDEDEEEEEEEEEESPDETESNKPEDDASENPEKENPDSVDIAELKMEDLGLESRPESRQREDSEESRRSRIKEIAWNDLKKLKSQQTRKYHSKRSTRNPGRPHGSKAKQDNRVKLSDLI